MAESDSGQERTEEPTPKRQEEARKKGQVARSRELNTAIIVIVGGLSVIAFQHNIGRAFYAVSRASFELERSTIFEEDFISQKIRETFFMVVSQFWPIFIILFAATFIGPVLLNGFAINFESLAPKLERMDPLKGLKRMFSIKALMELVKALLKFLLIATVAVVLLWFELPALLSLGHEPIKQGIIHALSNISWSFVIMSASLMLIASIDVPFQIWEHAKQLKMTRQEIKDEMKETEGRPEVKSRIRQVQQEMAYQRMMQKVPKADVIVTNPSHYAVALKYNRDGNGAPVLLAKGMNLIAQRIMEIGDENDISVLRIPLLARAIYYHTKLDAEIPVALYESVAHVLAYVYQLKTFEKGQGKRPKPLPDLTIPEHMIHDE